MSYSSLQKVNMAKQYVVRQQQVESARSTREFTLVGAYRKKQMWDPCQKWGSFVKKIANKSTKNMKHTFKV